MFRSENRKGQEHLRYLCASGMCFLRLPAAFAIIASCLLTGSALAGTVREDEYDNQANNNTRATAQRITVGNFNRNENPNVFGHKPTASITGHILGADLDWYSFDATPGQAYFDLDANPSSFIDVTLALYDDTGTLLALATDNFAGGADAGSKTAFDPFLGEFDIPATGTYYIALAERPTQTQMPSGYISAIGPQLTRPDGRPSGSFRTNSQPGNDSFPFNSPQPATADFFDTGTYTLHLSGSNLIPFGGWFNWSRNGGFASVFGGASEPGGVDMKLINPSNPTIVADLITNKSDLPPIEGFMPAGTSLSAWEIQVFGVATRFDSAEIYFGYDEADILAAGLSEEDLRIYHFVGGQWVAGGVVDPAYNEIFLATDTFSPFVLGVVPEPSTFMLAVLGLAALASAGFVRGARP